MSKPIQLLIDEHVYILKVVDALIKECEEIENGKEIDEKFFAKTIDFIRSYADKFHHAKEEDILFKEMCKQGTQEKLHCNPIDQMLHEHDLGREFVKNMEDEVKEDNKEKVIENGRGYAQLLQEHIYKEDNILYPMADEALDNEELEEMEKKFMKIGIERKEDKERYTKFAKGVENKK
ncbi:MAG: hemerythrin domain-containing protein [Nanoarchaeota archaeon]|nr:hemerythrin domain-containing protein [Nanoarchaeota archaeon]